MAPIDKDLIDQVNLLNINEKKWLIIIIKKFLKILKFL